MRWQEFLVSKNWCIALEIAVFLGAGGRNLAELQNKSADIVKYQRSEQKILEIFFFSCLKISLTKDWNVSNRILVSYLLCCWAYLQSLPLNRLASNCAWLYWQLEHMLVSKKWGCLRDRDNLGNRWLGLLSVPQQALFIYWVLVLSYVFVYRGASCFSFRWNESTSLSLKCFFSKGRICLFFRVD